MTRQLDYELYFTSLVFGVPFTALGDPGGGFGKRVRSLAIFGVVGAALTALGF